MKRTKKLISFVLVWTLLFSLSAPALAAESAVATSLHIEETEGTVTVKDASGGSKTVRKGMRLYSGYTVETSAASFAYISMDESKAVKLDSLTRIEVKKSGKQLEAALSSGQLFFNVTAPLHTDESLHVRTATMVTGLRGTSGWANPNQVGILEGEGQVTHTDPETGDTVTESVPGGNMLTYQSAPAQEGSGGNTGGGEYTNTPIQTKDVPAVAAEEVAKDPALQQSIDKKTENLNSQEIAQSAEGKRAAQNAQEQGQVQQSGQAIEQQNAELAKLTAQNTNTGTDQVFTDQAAPAGEGGDSGSQGGTGSDTGGNTGGIYDGSSSAGVPSVPSNPSNPSNPRGIPSTFDAAGTLPSFDELQAALTANNTVNIINTGDSGYTLPTSSTGALTVPAGHTFNIFRSAAGGTEGSLTVPSSGSGTALQVAGTVNADVVTVKGSVTVDKDGTIQAKSITITETGHVETSGAVYASDSEGLSTISGNSLVILAGKCIFSGKVTVTGKLSLSGGLLNFLGSTTIQGTATVIFSGGTASIPTLILKTGSKLTLSGNASLDITNLSMDNGVVIALSGKNARLIVTKITATGNGQGSAPSITADDPSAVSVTETSGDVELPQQSAAKSVTVKLSFPQSGVTKISEIKAAVESGTTISGDADSKSSVTVTYRRGTASTSETYATAGDTVIVDLTIYPANGSTSDTALTVETNSYVSVNDPENSQDTGTEFVRSYRYTVTDANQGSEPDNPSDEPDNPSDEPDNPSDEPDNPSSDTGTFTVTFNANNGSSNTSQTVLDGGKAVKPADPTRTNYVFAGWFTDSALTTAYDFTSSVTANLTLYAGWGHTVTFNANGGSSVTSQTVLDGGKAVKPADPTRTNYVFAGWFTDSSLTTAYDFTSSVAANLTLYAGWGHTVTFNANGGSSVTSQTVLDGGKAVKPTDPTKTNYVFVGWFTDSTLATAYDFTPNVTADLTLYAGWGHTVTFNANGGSSDTSQTVLDGKKVDKPADPTRTNYVFAGWFTDSALTTAYDFTSSVAANLTLYAGWGHTVTFNANGGSSVTSQTVLHGKTAVKPADPAKDSFVFVGWYKDSALATAYDFTSAVTADLTLYAGWGHTVTFDTNGGSSVTSQTVLDGKKVDKPADPTKDNLVFVGWYTNSTLATAYDFTPSVTADLTLYAGWGHTVTFNANNGSAVADQKVLDGQTITKPEPTWTDNGETLYDFAGWYVDELLVDTFTGDPSTGDGTWSSNQFDFTTAINQDYTFYAKWKTYGNTLSGSTLTIRGSGPMQNYKAVDITKDEDFRKTYNFPYDYWYALNSPWRLDFASINNVVLESGVTTIGDYAFFCSPVSSVTINGNITKIGDGAFAGGGQLTSITIPSGVTTIGACAFNQSGLSGAITIPASVKTIGKDAFSGTGITTVYYGGTETEWAAAIGSRSNVGLDGATVFFNATATTSYKSSDFAAAWESSSPGMLKFNYNADSFNLNNCAVFCNGEKLEQYKLNAEGYYDLTEMIWSKSSDDLAKTVITIRATDPNDATVAVAESGAFYFKPVDAVKKYTGLTYGSSEGLTFTADDYYNTIGYCYVRDSASDPVSFKGTANYVLNDLYSHAISLSEDNITPQNGDKLILRNLSTVSSTCEVGPAVTFTCTVGTDDSISFTQTDPEP